MVFRRELFWIIEMEVMMGNLKSMRVHRLIAGVIDDGKSVFRSFKGYID